VARRTGQSALGDEALVRLSALPRLRIAAVGEQLGREAASIAARLRLRGADAVYVAVARHLSAPLATFDSELANRAAAVIPIVRP
jgi:predicted nucleic acid-binding protein